MVPRIRRVPNEGRGSANPVESEVHVIAADDTSVPVSERGEASACKEGAERVDVHRNDLRVGDLSRGLTAEPAGPAPHVYDPPRTCPGHFREHGLHDAMRCEDNAKAIPERFGHSIKIGLGEGVISTREGVPRIVAIHAFWKRVLPVAVSKDFLFRTERTAYPFRAEVDCKADESCNPLTIFGPHGMAMQHGLMNRSDAPYRNGQRVPR